MVQERAVGEGEADHISGTAPELPREVSRRVFLGGAASLLVTGCATTVQPSASPAAQSTPGPTPIPTFTPEPTPTPSPPPTPSPSPTPEPTATPTPEPTPTPGPEELVELAANPFTLGVASGDALASSVVLWTRLMVDQTDPLAIQDIPVRLQLSENQDFAVLAVDQLALAPAQFGHSVHVDAQDLQPGTSYWYRFAVGGYQSQLGQTRTLPGPGEERFTFVLAACQGFQFGEYAAWRDVSGLGGVDAVVFTGDYIYEQKGEDFSPEQSGRRAWTSPSPSTLQDFRRRYEQTKSDGLLQAAHAALPWFITWDDHEITDNYWNDGSGQSDPAGGSLPNRRVAAYQAWWEHQPVRGPAPLDGSHQVYRSVDLADLGTMFLTDTRQFADRPPCREISRYDYATACPEAFDPSRQILGAQQEQWLLDGLANSSGTWSVLVSPVMFSGLEAAADSTNGAPIRYLETWDGYAPARLRVAQALRETASPVILSGDYHAGFVMEAGPGFGEAPICAEIMSPAISSFAFGREVIGNNPHVQHFDPRNGYTIISLTSSALEATFRWVEDVWNPMSRVETVASFSVDRGATSATRL